ncbi:MULTISPECIES: MFS transporter [Pseudomonas]|uniref:MFS family permease n=1 Tax=Pseudomonas hunanensis TaxID=1247546 RepID=A0ACC6K364_9PSED|nr:MULTISPECIES: MFS transporter [Pseudomonas]MBP2262778.1 MFS family permease [Pseudomonas sp. BP8]MDR6712878.1 MFS family permease [Pseudomonas hunanensis]HDS1737636.1 MFS transporter [Pseudomonas putida]
MTAAKDPASLKPASTLDLRPLLLVNMACTMSMMAFVALIGPIARLLGLATWQAGAAVTVAGVVWVLLARPWGRAADRYGRRRVLLLGSAGFTLAYWLLCLFIDGALHWLPGASLAFLGLMLARGMIGAFYAALPVAANALVADHVEPQQRARAMASLGAANAVGLVLGPAVAALLARHSLSMPFWIMSILPATAFLVLLFKLKPQPLAHNHAPNPVRLGDPRLRRPLLVAFSAMLSVTVSQITVGFFALDRLGLPSTEAAQVAGIALTTVGVALMLSQILLRRLEWPALKMIRVGASISALGFAAASLAASAEWLWAAFFIAAAGMGFVFPAFSALAANAMHASEQGATAGSIGAAQGMGAVIGPLAGTLVYALDPRLPFLAVALLLLLVGLWPMPAAARR